MQIVKSLVTLTIIYSLVGCSTAITPEVTAWKGKIKVYDDYYRSQGSADAELGSYGRRLNSGLNHYRKDGILINKFLTRKPRVVILTFDNVSELKNLGFKIASEAELELSSKVTSKGKYSLVVVKPIDPSKFEKAARLLFSSDTFFKDKAKNKDFRYIDSVVYLIDYEESKDINLSAVGNANIDRVARGFNLNINTGRNHSSTIKLPDGQVIGYQFRRLCWKNGLIIDAVPDAIGIDAHACGQGYYKYPGK